MLNAFLCGGRGTNFLSPQGTDPSTSNKTNENTLPIEMDSSKISDNTTYRCREETSKFTHVIQLQLCTFKIMH